LSANVDATSFVHDTLIRHDQSDFEFLVALARRNGYALIFDDDKLQFKKAETISNGQVACEYGVDLIEFRPRFSLGGQVDQVKVHGWDLVAKQEVVGVATTPVFKPAETGYARGATAARQAFNSQSLHVTASPKSQALADGLAKSVAERMAASDMTAEGVVLGNVNIKPGGKLELKNLGRFSGKYFVRRVLHHFVQEDAYTTQVWLGGLESGTLASLLRDDPRTSPSSTGRQSGLIRAIVTDINDPDGYARVKVKLPTMGDDIQTFWASVVSAGAGNDRGFYVLPEINDEVIVGFIDGDVNYPVVLGGLWNGKDAPPQLSSAVSNGTVDIREFKTRVGHVLRFTDKSGDEKIELIDKTGSNLIKIVSGENTISINAAKDIVLEAKGDIVLKAVNIKLEGSAKVEVGAPVVEAAGDSQINLKAPMATLAGSGMTKITGGMVQIN
jgi:uncharacterized protein involved in type VI secretion and phage assembly